MIIIETNAEEDEIPEKRKTRKNGFAIFPDVFW